jgi:hypothetical protein
MPFEVGEEVCFHPTYRFTKLTLITCFAAAAAAAAQMPFEVGEEVCFRPNGQLVEGIVVDVGWYRTLIR